MSVPNMDAESFAQMQFDYVIVGGGTAGLVVASRLSEVGRMSVGVIEAGLELDDDLPAVSVPGRSGEGIGTEYDWQFVTKPQQELGGREVAWPRGKALGGSSVLNFMIWNRPNREDLDEWQRLGCHGWGFDDMLPFYMKSESFVEPDCGTAEKFGIHYDANVHGTAGPVRVTFNKEYSALHEYWQKTLNNLGVETNISHMSGDNSGAWTSMVAVDDVTARRVHSAKAYHHPIRDRKNLHILTGAHVDKVVLQKVGNEWIATGVRFKKAGVTYVVSAAKEVILSAGSINSPHLLECSGIGSPQILNDAGIETKVPLQAVGEGLKDHIMTISVFRIDPSIPTPDDLRSDLQLASVADEEFNTRRTGRRTHLACSLAYLPLNPWNYGGEVAVVRHHRMGAAHTSFPQEQRAYVEFIFDVGNWSPTAPTRPGEKYATMLQILQHPRSTGNVHVNAKNVYGPPDIDPRYYEGAGEIDVDIHVHALELSSRIVSTAPLRHFVHERVWPPADICHSALRSWVTDYTTTDWHPIGTCGMTRVVDERLKVYGIRGLRVVDASVMPTQIAAHLQATVYAIAEKGAAMILQDEEQEG